MEMEQRLVENDAIEVEEWNTFLALSRARSGLWFIVNISSADFNDETFT